MSESSVSVIRNFTNAHRTRDINSASEKAADDSSRRTLVSLAFLFCYLLLLFPIVDIFEEPRLSM